QCISESSWTSDFIISFLSSTFQTHLYTNFPAVGLAIDINDLFGQIFWKESTVSIEVYIMPALESTILENFCDIFTDCRFAARYCNPLSRKGREHIYCLLDLVQSQFVGHLLSRGNVTMFTYHIACIGHFQMETCNV